MHTSIRRYNTDFGTRSTNSSDSDASQDSQSTAPTSYYSNTRPSLSTSKTEPPLHSKSYGPSPVTFDYPRSSTETYQSAASEEDLFEEPESYDPEYEVPEYQVREGIERKNLRPSTPSDFAAFFPSSKRLHIRHDDTTFDGNMNLRVDAEDPTSTSKRKANVTLFHMRMHDLKKREFSLRRYERSSGREVCHSSRKYVKPAVERRPTLTRSVTSAFSSLSMKKPEFKRTNTSTSIQSVKSSSTTKAMRRQDSGYGSSEDISEEVEDFMSEKKSAPSVQIPTNTTKLEFSNYAQVEVKRRGAKSSKRYDFEFWGQQYSWKRVSEKDGQGKAVSYHLFRDDGASAVAHIVPEMRSPSQIRDEFVAGGWVPPCSMWISDKSVLEALTDVADVIVSTGLIALVDDCIKRHFHTKPRRQLTVPLTQLNMEFVGPRALVEHMFKRRNSGNSSKSGSPLKHASPIAAY